MIVEVTRGATTSHVRIEIGPGIVITASITNEAVADLALQKRGGPGCLSRFSASISGVSAGVRLPSGMAVG